MGTRFIDLFYSLYKFYTTRVTYNTQQILWTRLKYTHTHKINHVLTNRTKQTTALFGTYPRYTIHSQVVSPVLAAKDRMQSARLPGQTAIARNALRKTSGKHKSCQRFIFYNINRPSFLILPHILNTPLFMFT